MFSSDRTNTGPASAAAGDRWRNAETEHARQRAALDPLAISSKVWSARRLIFLTTLVGIAAAVLVALLMPRMYTATTQILVDPRDIKVVQNEVTPNGLPSEATLALIESQVTVAYSNSVLYRVIEAAELTQDPEFNGTGVVGFAAMFPEVVRFFTDSKETGDRLRLLRTLSKLRDHLLVTREVKSFVINISVESTDPEKAARLSQLVADTFIDEIARAQSDTARRATEDLSSRLEELRADVVAAERESEDYKAKNALVGVGGRLIDDAYITQINQRLAEARGNISTLRSRSASMASASVDDVVKGTLPEELTSQLLARLRTTYSDLAQQAASLRSKLGPRHPQRIAIEQALASARQDIASELSRIVAGAKTELARAEETERDLARQIDALKTKQIDTSGSLVKLRELEREVEAARLVYEAYLLRARETGEQQGLNTANVRVISAATPPLEPSSLSRRIIVLIGAILGFLTGLLLATTSALFSLARAAERRGDSTAAALPAGAAVATGHFGGGWPSGWSQEVTAGAAYAGSGAPSASAAESVRPSHDATAEPADASSEDAQPAAGKGSDELRREIRQIAERRRMTGVADASEDATPPRTQKLQEDIDSVKQAVADLRRRRDERAARASVL